MTIPINERVAQQITAALPDVCDEEEAKKLHYIRKQITETGLSRRSEDDQDVSHLLYVARSIIRRFTVKEPQHAESTS